MAKSAGILKLVDEKAVSSFKPWKSQLYINFIFSLHKLSNSIAVAPSGIKSEPDNEFQSLGNQKVYESGKRSILKWKLGHPFQLKI